MSVNVKELPLVSCIMPTYNRRRFVPFAIEYFLRQEYSNKELIIIDDGDDNVEDLITDNSSIRYFRLDKKITLGAKLNLACSYARGEIIANWDDDDWYAPSRLEYQVNALKINKAEVCGINELLYYDLKNNLGYRYVYPADQKKWLLGSSLCYTKKLWCRNHFADINVGMDGLFVWAVSPDFVQVLPDSTMSVHMIHENNVSPKKTDGKWWHSYPVEALQKIMKSDWALYVNGNGQVNKKLSTWQHISRLPGSNNTRPVKNIFACLVHEREECIIDLVRNLHYHDSSSAILLYNGGANKKLFSDWFPYEKFGAVIHPKPSLTKHGYLHGFALDCMEFALENFSFDTITMVDSDQLALHGDYTRYLQTSLILDGVGMLSNKPGRLTYSDKADVEVWPATQAFKEFDLWKPLLQQFKDGESKFVHWTFWPSSVFSSGASNDLIKLFKQNKLLQSIMKQTKIWATEEVILPTLVALLGYKIVANPCSYDFVKYQKSFSIRDIDTALNKTDAFWVHPVRREYHDPLRSHIRQHCNYYIKRPAVAEDCMPGEMLMTLSLINKIKKIEGWLSDNEADLLISTTINACINLPQPLVIVEVGCYHGKSTVIFGSVLQKLFPSGKVYSIDPHDGKLGAEGRGLNILPPSFEMFKKNIAEAGINELVQPIKDHSYKVKWDKPISLLFIDGLHDYINVSGDFWHFAKWIIKDGYVAFHDYADYFPGVQALVNELLATGEYSRLYKVDSLIVLKKL